MATNRKKELGKRYAPGQSPIARADAATQKWRDENIIGDIATGFIPGIGEAGAYQDFRRDLGESNYGMAALSGASMFPFLGAAIRPIAKGVRAVTKGSKAVTKGATKALGDVKMPHKTKFHDPATITYGPGSTRGTPSTGGVSVRDSKALKAGKKELKDLKREYNEIVGKYDGASPQIQKQMDDRGWDVIQRQQELKGYQKLQKKLIQKDINANKMLGGTPDMTPSQRARQKIIAEYKDAGQDVDVTWLNSRAKMGGQLHEGNYKFRPPNAVEKVRVHGSKPGVFGHQGVGNYSDYGDDAYAVVSKKPNTGRLTTSAIDGPKAMDINDIALQKSLGNKALDARMETFVPEDLIQEIMYMKDLKF